MKSVCKKCSRSLENEKGRLRVEVMGKTAELTKVVRTKEMELERLLQEERNKVTKNDSLENIWFLSRLI